MKTLQQVEKQVDREVRHACRHCHTAGGIYTEDDTIIHERVITHDRIWGIDYVVRARTLYHGQRACRYCHRLQTKEGDWA